MRNLISFDYRPWPDNDNLHRVLASLIEPLLEAKYIVLRYNSRGVGKSTGSPSLTGFGEAEDLQALVQWSLGQIGSITSLVLIVSPVSGLTGNVTNWSVVPGILPWIIDHIFTPCLGCTHQDVACPPLLPVRSERMAHSVPDISLPGPARASFER